MNPIDLDSARSRWQAQGRQLGEQWQLDAERLAALLKGRASTQLERRRRSLIGTSVVAGLCLSGLIWFCLRVSDLPYQVAAGAIGLFVAASILQGLAEWRVLKQLPGFIAPAEAMALVMKLRRRELALTRAILSCSVLLWWPAVLVVARILGADLLRQLDPSVTLVHVGLGLIVLPLVWWFLRWFERRGAQGDELDRTGSGGDALLEIAWQYRTLVQLNSSTPASGLEPVGVAALEDARRLQRRLQWGCVACCAMLFVNGGHMMHRGGEWLVLTTGIVFQLSVVALMVSTIMAAEQWRHLRRSEPLLSVWERRVPRIIRRRAEILTLLVQLAPVALACGLVSWLDVGLPGAAILVGSGLAGAWLLNPSASGTATLHRVRATVARILSFGTQEGVDR